MSAAARSRARSAAAFLWTFVRFNLYAFAILFAVDAAAGFLPVSEWMRGAICGGAVTAFASEWRWKR